MIITKIVQAYDYICAIIDSIVKKIVIAAFFTILGVYLLQIVFRYMGRTTAWVNEYAGYTLVFLTFWGSSSLVYSKDHIVVNFFKKKFPVKLIRAIEILTSVVLLYYFHLYLRFGWRYVMGGRGLLTPSRAIEVFYPRLLAFYIGCILIVIQTLNVLLQDIFMWEEVKDKALPGEEKEKEEIQEKVKELHKQAEKLENKSNE